MVNKIGTVYPFGLNKRFSPRSYEDSRVRHETPEEGRRTYRPKSGEYNNKDEFNSPNIINNNIFLKYFCIYVSISILIKKLWVPLRFRVDLGVMAMKSSPYSVENWGGVSQLDAG